MDRLLEIKDLTVEYVTFNGTVRAVDRVWLTIDKGETVGMVGESGCGKSTVSLAVMRLLPNPPARIKSGEILFEGEDILKKSEEEMKQIRGGKISMVFQEPMTSLNPVYTIGKQVSESIIVHQKVSRAEAKQKAIEMLKLVKIPNPEKRFYEYPHQLSGGMRQRVMIAMALSCNPKLLIADEPTTALDVTIQAQILELISELKRQFNMSVLLITHNLGIIAEMANRVFVMYAGQVVEEAPCDELFDYPLHPYTEALLKSIPRLESGKGPLHTIPGSVPDLMNLPSGCRFHPRCSLAIQVCREKEPSLMKVNDKRRVRCFLRGSKPEEVDELEYEKSR